MKDKRFHAHSVSQYLLGKETFLHTWNQSMKVKSFHAHSVSKYLLRKEAS